MSGNNSFAGKRLLVLGGAVQCLKVIETAKEMGVYTIVADMAENPPAKKIADRTIRMSVLDADGLISWISKNPVDGVLNFNVDFSQMTHQRVCEYFGLPSFGTKEQYAVLNEKRRFKQFCIENGVDVIPDYTPEDIESGRAELPVLVKPSDSSGSRAVRVCETVEEFRAALAAAEKESKDGKAVIEKYMGGKQDFIVVYLITDGKVNLIRIGDRFLGRREDGLDRQGICTICPSRFTEHFIEHVNPRVVKMLENLGMKNGPVFIQGFIDGDTVRFYDPGVRFPGGEFDRILKAATGIDTVKMVIGYALGGKMSDLDGQLGKGYLLNGKCAITLCIDSAPGEIGEYDIEKVRDIDGVVHAAAKAHVGSVIPKTGDVKQRVAEVVLLIDNDLDTIKRKINEVKSAIIVKDKDGNDLIVSPMDTDLLH